MKYALAFIILLGSTNCSQAQETRCDKGLFGQTCIGGVCERVKQATVNTVQHVMQAAACNCNPCNCHQQQAQRVRVIRFRLFRR